MIAGCGIPEFFGFFLSYCKRLPYDAGYRPIDGEGMAAPET